MCGIAGYVTKDTSVRHSSELEALCEGILHRGPDDMGSLELPGVGLAMRRLSIVDVLGSRQPIANEDGTVHVVFNGEIYNYVELRAGLAKRGHVLSTQGDSEVLVHLYEEHGTAMLSHLRGMFAFALWDSRKNLLMLARDRLGKKPLNYALSNGTLYFCSEIAPLAALPTVSREIDLEALAAYLTSGYVPSPRTIYKGIRKLPAAHVLTWQGGKVRMQRYWQLDHTKKIDCDYPEAVDRLRNLLDESIRIRLRSDVPLGLMLSSGLDSNAILSRLVRGLGSPVKTFTIGFEEKRYDESDLAAISARHFGVEHVALPGKADLLDLAPQLTRHYGEPFADKSALPTFLLCELTRHHVKVALSGDGGDEAFAGYSKYRLSPWQKIAANLLPVGMRAEWARRSLQGRGMLGSKASRNFRRTVLPDTESLFTSEFFSGTHFASLSTPDLKHWVSESPAFSYASFWQHSPQPVDRMLNWDYEHYLTDDLLVKMDIASMARGLEVRSPFLDQDLVEFCASMPAEWKVNSTGGKLILRDLVEPDLPPQIKAASKRGFSVPLEQWWRGAARERIRSNLVNLHPGLRPFIKQQHVCTLVDEHQEGRRNHAQRLWCLAVMNTWAHQNL